MARISRMSGVCAVAAGLVLFGAVRAAAHCDRLDGPVVKAAQAALAARDANLVLIWVGDADEQEVRRAFERTLTVRALGADARELADRFFFETVVRLHRAGEGEPYTGLQPAGIDPGPAIAAADRAVAAASAAPVLELIAPAIERGIREHFAQTAKTKQYARGDLHAGREHVKAYVTFLHYVERLYEAARTKDSHHD